MHLIKNIVNHLFGRTPKHHNVYVWNSHRALLKELLAKEDLDNFLNWEIVRDTMYHFAKPTELEYLQNRQDWSLWKKALIETTIGNPPNNLNLIHQAYSLAQYFDDISKLKNISAIVEIGGGYGCMRRLIHELGFRGKYTIFDFPEFLSLQKYYLGRLNIPTIFTSEPNNLKGELYIALWSVSEMPLEQRDAVLKNAKRYLIAYQQNFEGIDNEAYFIEFMLRENGWRRPIAHLDHSTYLMR
ncbi:MAG: hypothetical protein AAB420_00495 [Patescibacteria group bacterium]